MSQTRSNFSWTLLTKFGSSHQTFEVWPSPEKTVCRYFATPLMIFIKQLNHWIMQFMAKSRTVYLSLDLLQYARKFQETTLSTWFMIFPVYQHPSESGKEKRWETGSIIKDAMFFRKLILLRSCYWFNIDVMVWYYLWFKCIFLCFNHIQLYCFYHHEKQNKTNTQTNKQTNNYCLYNQLLLKNITVFLGRINYWWWENANKQDHASHGAWKTLASF